MIHSLTIKSIRLITNNPEKIRQLEAHRVVVSGRIPHIIAPNEFNRLYLQTKGTKSGHLDIGRPRLVEQSDPLQVDGMAGPRDS